MSRKTALITGAASGIGFALAARLARSGHALYLVDRSDALADAARQLREQGAAVHADQADVASEAELVRIGRQARERMEGCAILVNCAGITPKGNGGPIPLEQVTVDGWERTHRINLVAPVVLCRELIPAMAQAGYGRVVNVASRAGRMHVPPASLDYHASKAGLIGVTRALAGIYADRGVTVNCVAPGRVDTPLTQSTRAELLDQARALIPMRRFASPDEIAAAIEFLVSPDASYVTGACVDANGGVYMN